MARRVEINNQLKLLIRRSIWDYAIEDNALFDIWEGRKETFSFNKTKLRARLLLSTSWYQLIDVLGINGLKEILSDEVINSIRLKDLRNNFFYAQKALHG